MFYKFSCMSGDFERFDFDGHAMTVREYKTIIIDKKRLVTGVSLSTNPQGDPLTDDTLMPSGSRVYVRRLANQPLFGRRNQDLRDHYCRRCGETGLHFFWLCPTIGDSSYDRSRTYRATGIPRECLRGHDEGGLLLSNGQRGVLRPNTAAFQRQLEMMAGTRSATLLLPEFERNRE